MGPVRAFFFLEPLSHRANFFLLKARARDKARDRAWARDRARADLHFFTSPLNSTE